MPGPGKRYLQQPLEPGSADTAGGCRQRCHAGFPLTVHGVLQPLPSFELGPLRCRDLDALTGPWVPTLPGGTPLRILLATDAAREGLNFQAHCTDLFHFDLPWNPGRIEQRNGRIDRKLQPAPEVRCHYFVLPQRVEDRVLEVLVKKTETIRKDLGSLSKVIDDDIERQLGQGIRHRDAEQLATEIEQADLHAALLPVIDAAATPDLVPKGATVLQPSEERRRSGSH